jgi:hypothetical protein
LEPKSLTRRTNAMPRIRTADYVRPTTAAKIAGVNRSRIDQLLTAGTLAYVEIDGHRFIKRTDVEAFRDQRRQPPQREE